MHVQEANDVFACIVYLYIFTQVFVYVCVCLCVYLAGGLCSSSSSRRCGPVITPILIVSSTLIFGVKQERERS